MQSSPQRNGAPGAEQLSGASCPLATPQQQAPRSLAGLDAVNAAHQRMGQVVEQWLAGRWPAGGAR